MDRLDFYREEGFALFKCNSEKRPIKKGWQNIANSINDDVAEGWIKSGSFIGAAIPTGIIVIDVDKKTEGGHKEDGEKPFYDVLEMLNIDRSVLDETFAVKTPSGGLHYYFYYNGSSPGTLTTGVDLKKNGGYVIGALGDKYKALNDNDIMEIPETLGDYISDLRGSEKERSEITATMDDSLLHEVLAHIPTEKFASNDDWFQFTASAITVFGNDDDVINTLESWSRKDARYFDCKDIRNRLLSMTPGAGYATGTFVSCIKPFKGAYSVFMEKRPDKKKEEPIVDIEDVEEKLPFKFLGYSEQGHFFMGRDDMITKAPKCKITSGHLLEIAPLQFWMDIKTNRSGGADWTYVIDLVINKSIKKGPYKKSSIRGVGIWEDNGEIIASDGENIIHKDGITPVREYESKYTYIRRADLGLKSVENIKAKEDFKELVWMCNNLAFRTEDDGKLLFGWIIASMFLSVISWRPVAYMKGESGVGKSWTMNNVVREILGDMCICPNKMSTVKGVLQAPGHDARMITIDELESSAEKAMMDVVKGLMTLARDSTTKNKESRLTGTADQEGQSKDFLSMFLFASIVESSEEDQDANRITAVNFKAKQNPKIAWEEIEARVRYAIDNGLGERIRDNAVFHRESIVKNVKTFKLEASKKADKQRAADQLGTIIAGWYHLENPGKVATREDAKAYLDTFDFSEQNDRGKGKMMEVIMSPILSYKVKYEEEVEVANRFDVETGESEKKIVRRERTVFSVLSELNEIRENGNPTSREYLNRVLMDYGIRYGTAKHHKHMVIALNHEGIKRMLPDSFAYKSNYFDYFKNHPDFVGKEKSVKFNGVVFQAMAFNVDFEEDDQDAF